MKVKHTYRFYPSEPQKRVLAKTFGCVRVAYNSALKFRSDSFKAGKTVNYNASSSALTAQKKTPQYRYLSEVSSIPLQQSLRHLQTAYSNFFAKRAAYPKFKRREGKQSAEYTLSGFKYDPANRNLVIARLGRLDVHWSREFKSIPTTVTVIRRENGCYFVTLALDETIKPVKKTGREVGIDLGVNRLATLSTGERIANPKFLAKNLVRLKRYQRVLSRRKKGSGRQRRQKLKVARCHAHIANSRKDHLDKVTTDLVRRFDVIAIEDLNVRGMVANHCLARAISDVGMRMFRTMLAYKTVWYGKELRVADRFFPSSKRCHKCGWISESMPLSVREWTCCKCGVRHDRDLNASHNILAVGQTVTGQGGKVRRTRTSVRERISRRAVNQPALECV